MNSHKIRLIGSLMFMAAACTGGNAFLFVDSILSPADQDRPAIMRAVDGIPGWTRTGGPEMHRALAVRALSEGESLNTFVVKSLKKAVSGRPPEAGMPDGSQGK